MSDGNMEKLQSAGLIQAGDAMSDDEKKAVNSLSDQEVANLIATGQRVGSDPGRVPTHMTFMGF